MGEMKMKSQYKLYQSIVSFILLTLLTGIVSAAQRTVCYRVRLADERTNCATPSEAGARRACNAGGYNDTVGHYIELWDKDWSSSDEKIGTWYINGSGTRCASFEWEGASYSKGEWNPDVYLKYINKVRKTGTSGSVTVTAVDTNGSSHPKTSWRNGSGSNPDRFVAMNCNTGSNCNVYSGSLVPTNARSSERAKRIMALDSAQHALQVFGGIMDTNVKMHYPGKDSCSTSCAVNRDEIHITESRGTNGFNVAHEVGHLVQMQEFNQDFLRDDCSWNGNGHNLSSIEHESCATTEGWANFVGVVSWYEPNNAATVPFGWGRNFETATLEFSSCSDNAHNTLQVAKSFWDLDDFNDELGVGAATGDDDIMRYNTQYIGRGWRQFGNGTGNRQDNESGADGVNMKDYFNNNINRFNQNLFETLIDHNCLSAQTNG